MISTSANDRGFTLIELLGVMTIMALLALLLIPRLTGSIAERPALTEARLLTSLRATASEAQRAGVARTVALPPGAIWQPDFPSATMAPRFFADGSAHGGVLVMGGRPMIRVGWLDGRVEALHGHTSR